MNLTSILGGVVAIIIGIILLNSKNYEKLVRLNADLRGVKPAISKITLAYGKVAAIIFIIMGVGAIWFWVTF